ncbi:hypothetical protein Tcan_14985 [Toxocara canis]|uniref:ZW10 C-terminal helical domain-containing protein n=1 Tax=Toxocara canis TaxID=6265 RepID=A0A0B2W2E5_TOXCA|nr:hypothetical protein Tcan_06860 [Toxocara canis]KHN87824.1 hypothetical protein Tcan_14985 [Toxocara canis]
MENLPAASMEGTMKLTKSQLFKVLKDVSDRWCGGKGPMAQWLSAKEVCGLVESLFQNTRKTAQLLADFSLSNVGSAGQ